MESNPQLELAYDFLEYTGVNVFLTGKAGTGKTTFLRELKRRSPKRMVVVAPTGVAAINAGGVTIHSFFQLPFGPYVPGTGVSPKRISTRKVLSSILVSLDLKTKQYIKPSPLTLDSIRPRQVFGWAFTLNSVRPH